jgi:hypothetical protein
MLFVTDSIQLIHSEYLTNKALEGFGDFKTGGQIMCTVEYAHDLAKEDTVLQHMTVYLKLEDVME